MKARCCCGADPGAVAGGRGFATIAAARCAASAGVQAWIASFALYLLFTSNPFVRIVNPPWKAMTSTRCCRITVSPRTLPSSISAMSASRSFFRSHRGADDRRIDAAWARGCGPGRWSPGASSPRYLAGIQLVLLRARLGRLVVLGPGEKAPFMPWLVGTALVHSLMVTQKRGGSGVDHPSCGPGLLALAAWHLPGAFRCPHVRPRLRQ